jgi:hypothetical protein
MTSEIEKFSFGRYGCVAVSNTSATAGNFCAMQCLTDTVVSAMTARAMTGSITGLTLPAGTVIYTAISSVTLTSGAVLLYRSE